jgi:drug/metabolite transporter (DMT)-like permease
MWLKYLGVESTHDFDSLSAALEMILLFGLTFVTLFYSAQTVYGRENRHNWWILAVCASVFGYCLVNSWIFLNMFVLRDMSLWWVHHIIVILKLSVIVYTYLKLLP